MTKKLCVTVLFSMVFWGSMLSCDQSESAGDLYTISSVVPDLTPVVLEGDLGTMVFDLSTAPVSDDQADMFLSYLSDATITLTVINDETSVSFNLSEGQLVDETPSQAGEYSATVSAAGDEAQVAFWNDFMGHSIVAGKSYTANLSVLANDYFTAEEIVSAVSVE